MPTQKKKTNTFIVQYIQIFLTGAFLVVNAYPAPALAFANQLQGSVRFQGGEFIEVTATAYSSSEGQTDASPFTTASGSRVRYGVVAANFLPLHTKIRIENEVFTVEDRMNSRYNNVPIIDIWMPSQDAALAFGTRTILIQIESEANNS
jgi:3D (Asp-Asp-Asp) domain-containing protein